MAAVQKYSKKNVKMEDRRAIAIRHGGSCGCVTKTSCTYCGSEGAVRWNECGWITFDDLEIDHVVPEFHGGPTEKENLVLACRLCNRSKGHSKEWGR